MFFVRAFSVQSKLHDTFTRHLIERVYTTFDVLWGASTIHGETELRLRRAFLRRSLECLVLVFGVVTD